MPWASLEGEPGKMGRAHVYIIKYQKLDVEFMVIRLAVYSQFTSKCYTQYLVVCPDMETDNFFIKSFPSK